MSDQGINELAAIVAWWLSHPWRLAGLYLLLCVIHGFVSGVFLSLRRAVLLHLRIRHLSADSLRSSSRRG